MWFSAHGNFLQAGKFLPVEIRGYPGPRQARQAVIGDLLLHLVVGGALVTQPAGAFQKPVVGGNELFATAADPGAEPGRVADDQGVIRDIMGDD